MTLFQALYGQSPPTILYYHPGMTSVNKVDQQLIRHNELIQQLKANLQVANNSMQPYANSKCCNVEFQEGDYIFLKLQPYRQQTVF